MVRASAAITREKNNAIHSVTEVDITEVKKYLKEHEKHTGEKLSFTAYLVGCFASMVDLYPEFNSFIRGNRLVQLEDVCISVMIEREFEGEKVPEPVGIHHANRKNISELSYEIRGSKETAGQSLGSLERMGWIRLIPGFLLKTFIRMANRNVNMAKRYGKLAVTAVGMFSTEPVWFIPHGTATVLLTVGSIIPRVVEINGNFESREHLCLTVSFDHNIIDGAPAARFMNGLVEMISRGDQVIDR